MKTSKIHSGSSILWNWGSLVGEILFPKVCGVCSGTLLDGENTICTTCRYDMPLTGYYNRKDNAVVELLAGRILFAEASALMLYSKGSGYQRLIHSMKYGGRDDIAVVLGRIYGAYLQKSTLYSDLDVVVPVPLHRTKLHRRGYNQSAEFARGIAQQLGIALELRALRRIVKTKTQATLTTNKDRMENVSTAFKVHRPSQLEGKRILLVDDVITTGATIESCAKTINQSVPNSTLYIGAIAIAHR